MNELFNSRTYEVLKGIIRKKPSAFSIFEKKENMQLVVRKKSNNCYLVDKTNKKAIELVDTNNNIVGFTTNDINSKILAYSGNEHMEAIKNLRAAYGLIISDFNEGIATIEWLLEKAGYFPFDEDGFGFEEWPSYSLFGKIDKEANVIQKFICSNYEERIIDIIDIIAKELNLPCGEIKHHHTLRYLSADETKVYSILSQIEKTYNLKWTDDEKQKMSLNEFLSVNDICHAISRKTIVKTER